MTRKYADNILMGMLYYQTVQNENISEKSRYREKDITENVIDYLNNSA